MANIREYSAPQDLGLTPSDRGIDATAAAARRIGTFYNQTADLYGQEGNEVGSTIRDVGGVIIDVQKAAQKRETDQQISHGSAAGTAAAANLDAAWNLTVNGGKDADGNVIPPADPNNPSIRAKFMQEHVEPAIDKLKEGFTTEEGQQFAERFTESMREHFSVKTAADISALAGVAAKKNAVTTVNNLASTVRSDPSSVDFALKTLDHTTDAMAGSATMDPATFAKIKDGLAQDGGKAIVQSYFFGLAEKNPGKVQAELDRGKYGKYLDPSDVTQILNYARVNARLNQSAADSARESQDHADKQAFTRAAIDLATTTLPSDPSQKPTLPPDYYDRARKLASMPGADLGHVRSMIEDGERIASRLNKPEPLATVSARSSMDIMTRMRATDDTHVDGEAAANKAYGDGEITAADRNMLVKEWQDSKTADGETLAKTKSAFFDAVEPMIVKPLSDITDDSAKLRLYRFQTDVNRKVDEYKRAGKNPRDLFDPTKPEFLGNPEFVNQPQYQSSLQGNLPSMAIGKPSVNLTGPGKDITGISVTPAPIPKREKGETLDSWMKRTGRGFAPPTAAAPAPPIAN